MPVLWLVVACGKPPALRAPQTPTSAPSGLAGSPSPAESRRTVRLGSLRDSIVRHITAVQGAEVAVWYHNFANGDTLAREADVSYHAASTMKVPVMIELFRRADAGTIALDQTMVLANQFRSIVDGSPYSLTAADDSDTEIYQRVGVSISYRELNERMITHSSNLATNVLIDVLDAGRVNETSRALGAVGMRVLRGVEDTKAYEKGLNNTTTARALGVLLDAIEHGLAASRTASDSMRAVLLRQTEQGEIPAGLPPGTRIAHKTGWITATTHDAAIVYPPGQAPYVLVLLTRKIADRPVAQKLMADISRVVWESATTSR